MTPASMLTLSILTIPEREEYLGRLLQSIAALRTDPPPHIDVVCNRPLDGALGDMTARIRKLAPSLQLEVYSNAGETSIVAGRNLQLSVCRTPLIAFVDDDLSLHGPVIPALLDTLANHPVGLVGLPSFDGASSRVVKPRESTPSVDWDGLKYKPVQGMLCAGYRALLADIGGFNMRRRYWGEWTELNLRMWRCGFPTVYQMDRGFMRHWEEAPSSPTRNMTGREQHVVWGLLCTALEYDAVDVTEATEVFWRLVEERYLAYSFGNELSPRNVLKTVLELAPQISAEWGSIQAFRQQTAAHRFQFAPFHRFTLEEVRAVSAHAATAIQPYRQRLSRDMVHVTAAVAPKPPMTHSIVPTTLRGAFSRLARSIRSVGKRL